MSYPDSLYDVVHAQFHEAFGQPHNVQGGGEQWTLEPTIKYRNSIHVVLNGTPDRPGVWIFDPHDHHNGVENTPIVEHRDIGDLIKLIQGRLDFANRGRGKSPSPAPPEPRGTDVSRTG
jgi:hypothetical protein